MATSLNNHNSGSGPFDVIILGDGPAGLATALRLHQWGITHCIVSKSKPNGHMVESIAPSVRDVCSDLGIADEWIDLCQRACFKEFCGVSQKWSDIAIVSTPFPKGQTGWHVDRDVLDRELREFVREKGTNCYSGVKIEVSRSAQSRTWQIRVMDDSDVQSFTAAFIVDASGKFSSFAPQVSCRFWLHRRQVAYQYRIDSSKEVNNDLRIASAPNGWWYRAPTSESRDLLAFVTDTDLVPTSERARNRYFEAEFQNVRDLMHPGSNRDDDSSLATTSTTSAAQTICFPWIGSGWILAGDSAMSSDPLSGQGFVRSLNEGLLAADVVAGRIRDQKEWVDHAYSELVVKRIGYLKTRQVTYASESRWPENSFWRTRREWNFLVWLQQKTS